MVLARREWRNVNVIKTLVLYCLIYRVVYFVNRAIDISVMKSRLQEDIRSTPTASVLAECWYAITTVCLLHSVHPDILCMDHRMSGILYPYIMAGCPMFQLWSVFLFHFLRSRSWCRYSLTIFARNADWCSRLVVGNPICLPRRVSNVEMSISDDRKVSGIFVLRN